MSTNGRPRGLYEAPFTVERPEKASQTLLSHIDSCPFSGALYLKHKGGPQTAAMARGEAFHDFVERALGMLLENDETHMPPDVAKDLMQAVLEERVDLSVPASEQDACRLMAWNFAAATVIEPSTVAGVEQMLEVQVGDFTVRGKLDLILRGDGWLQIKDWKTSLSLPSIADYEQSFQPQLYALLALDGVPEGGGTPIGKGLSEVQTLEVYPRFRKDSGGTHIDDYDVAPGEMISRYATYDRGHLADFRRTVEALLTKLEHGIETGEWAAQESSHCRICPARGECPIPLESRALRVITTEAEAREAASHLAGVDEDAKLTRAAVKEWCGENGHLVMGDEEWGFKLERRETAQKDAIKELLRECGQDPADFFRESTSTRFAKRRVQKEAA